VRGARCRCRVRRAQPPMATPAAAAAACPDAHTGSPPAGRRHFFATPPLDFHSFTPRHRRLHAACIALRTPAISIFSPYFDPPCRQVTFRHASAAPVFLSFQRGAAEAPCTRARAARLLDFSRRYCLMPMSAYAQPEGRHADFLLRHCTPLCLFSPDFSMNEAGFRAV